ncbi:hypothetical protein IFM89_020069 [Coptis chinensis]|uniref:F-box associated beta-propeller type 3 domain-containing protein n=1 Tax=Coptis chinensis TaxID=261450 RepID=A0A835LHV7_9MAGN|nr:hypothetical protein IFM89_020069 [Coptis chinensis]
MKLPMEQPEERFTCLASCRGLMCYRNPKDNSICICNPIIGDNVKIPLKHCDPVSWGFGYAPLSKKYKCIELFCKEIQREQDSSVTVMKLYIGWMRGSFVRYPLTLRLRYSNLGRTGFQEVWTLMNEAENTWVKTFSFPKIHKKQAEGGSENRCLSYNPRSDLYSVIQLPFANDVDSDSTSPELVITHVGSLLSPSEIVGTNRKQSYLSQKKRKRERN